MRPLQVMAYRAGSSCWCGWTLSQVRPAHRLSQSFGTKGCNGPAATITALRAVDASAATDACHPPGSTRACTFMAGAGVSSLGAPVSARLAATSTSARFVSTCTRDWVAPCHQLGRTACSALRWGVPTSSPSSTGCLGHAGAWCVQFTAACATRSEASHPAGGHRAAQCHAFRADVGASSGWCVEAQQRGGFPSVTSRPATRHSA